MLRILFVVTLMALCLPLRAAEHILTPYLGLSEWSANDGHTASGAPLAFRDKNQLTMGFRYLYMFDSGVAIGGNFYFYDMDVSTPAQTDDSAVFHHHFLVEYFFSPGADTSAFIGAGVGASAIAFSGGPLDDEATGGPSYELNAGVLFRLNHRVGLQLEYKYTDFSLDENIDSLFSDIDTNSSHYLLGLTIHL